MRDEPNKHLIEAKLATVTATVAQTLRKALDTSESFFGEDSGLDWDWTLFTVRARYEAARHFRLTHLDSIEDPDAIMSQTVGNIGLQLFHNGILIKILKGRELPVPTTKARVAFYDNSQTQWVVVGKDDLRVADLNVVYLWDCDPSTKQWDYFSLVCPKSGGFAREEVSAFWASQLAIPPKPIVIASRLVSAREAPLSDLDIAPLAPSAPAVNESDHNATSPEAK